MITASIIKIAFHIQVSYSQNLVQLISFATMLVKTSTLVLLVIGGLLFQLSPLQAYSLANEDSSVQRRDSPTAEKADYLSSLTSYQRGLIGGTPPPAGLGRNARVINCGQPGDIVDLVLHSALGWLFVLHPTVLDVEVNCDVYGDGRCIGVTVQVPVGTSRADVDVCINPGILITRKS